METWRPAPPKVESVAVTTGVGSAKALVGFEVEQQAPRVGLFDWLFAMNRRFALPRLATMTAAVIIAFSGFMLGGGLGESMAQERYANTQASNELTEFLVSDGI